MNRVQTKSLVSLVLNILTLILTAVAVCCFFTEEEFFTGPETLKAGGMSCFMFFTTDSNVLAALSSLFLLPYTIKTLRTGCYEIPAWVLLLKFIGTAAVTMTFAIVLLFLGPMMGYASAFDGNLFFLHLICPLLCIISFCFFEHGLLLSGKQALWGVLPTLIYGILYLVNVIFRKTWIDFYNFNIGGFWYISFVVLHAVSYLLAIALRAMHNKAEKQSEVKFS